MPIRDILVVSIVFICIPFILKRPEVGVWVWSWLGYMNPHKLSWEFAHTFPLAQIVALTTISSLLVSKGSKRILWTREIILIFLFFIWATITTIFSLYPELAWPEWSKVGKIFLMSFVSMIIIQNRRNLQIWIWVIALSLGFYGFKGGLFTLATGGGYAVYGPRGTFIGGNNEIGLALIMIIPFLRYCQINTDNVWLQRIIIVGMLLCFIAVLGTQSRGAFLGVTAISLFLIKNSRHKWTFLIFILLALPIIYFYMPESWHERISTIKSYEDDRSAMGRINAWMMAFNLASERLLGGGFNCFQPASFALYAPNPSDIHDAHSIYFEVLGEHGFIGLAIFLSIGICAWRSCVWVMKYSKKADNLKWAYDLAAMLQVSLLGYAVSGAFLGLAYFDLYYNLVILIVLVKMITKDTLEENASTVIDSTSSAPVRSFVVKPRT